MGHRFAIGVVILWAAAMGWLVVAKVLPPLLAGDPPAYSTTLPEPGQAVCWQLEWNGRPLGWAATKSEPPRDGVTVLHGRLSIDGFPYEDLRRVLGGKLLRERIGPARLEARSFLEIGPSGHLQSVTSSVDLGEASHAIVMHGEIAGGKLLLQVRTGSVNQFEAVLPEGAFVASELAPQAELPNLKLGQSWTTPAFSPFRPSAPVEMLQAIVEEDDLVEWQGRPVQAWRVVFRSDAGAGLSRAVAPRGKMWVSHRGQVLIQELEVFNCTLRFLRLTPEQSEVHARLLSDDWLTELPGTGAEPKPKAP